MSEIDRCLACFTKAGRGMMIAAAPLSASRSMSSPR